MSADPTFPYDRPEPCPVEPDSAANPGACSAAEARTASRLTDLGHIRLLCMSMAARMSEAVADRLPDAQREPFERVKDPCSSLARLTRVLLQVVVLEEEIDGKREAARYRDTRVAAFRNRHKVAVQRGMRAAIVGAEPTISTASLRTRLNDIFREFSDYGDPDEETPEAVVARICDDLGIPVPDSFATDDSSNDAADSADAASEPDFESENTEPGAASDWGAQAKPDSEPAKWRTDRWSFDPPAEPTAAPRDDRPRPNGRDPP